MKHRRTCVRWSRWGRLILVLGLAPGCATTPTGEGAIPLSRLETAPALGGCGAYQEPALAPNLGATSVTFAFVVDETGTVVPASIQLLPGRRGLKPLPDDLISRARNDLLSCSFTPGRLEGRAVRTRMEKRFRYPDGA